MNEKQTSQNPRLRCENIGKSFFGVPVLQDIHFSLQPGQILGLVGENGAGKSTLMNILGGVFPPDSGILFFNNEHYQPRTPSDAFRSGIAFIHQELNLFTNLSVAENIFIHNMPKKPWLPFLDYRAMLNKTSELLREVDLEIAPQTPVENLSQGERQLVEIAKALSMDAPLIIFDEPTTSLTAKESERLFHLIRRLRQQGRSMIYISHALGDVMSLSDEILVLRDGRVVGQGKTSQFTLELLVSQMVGRAIEQLYPPRTGAPSSEVLLEIHHLSQPGFVHDINLKLHRGEILGISGLMGSGRSELARIIFGLDSFESGEILIGHSHPESHTPRESIRNGMAFLTENRREEGLMMNAVIAENIALVSLPSFSSSAFGFISRDLLSDEVKAMAESIRLRCASLDRQPVKTLSGGNQQKVVLGKWLLHQPTILILDEPTRGIDVGAKYEIYKIIDELTAKGIGVLFISSEIEELMGMCDRILVMRQGEIRYEMLRSDFDRESILRAALRESSAS